ncbi:hypothetical protein CI102_4903 [Trichoderma harzianum]|uniref:Uncharacterized protein n=1 Tax=Trichoderma harzianum CBS 226.95 TaxID=983964 RepID=A0A2T4ATI3_TRIHA|nr:hypothetical protein M431DRAFT_176770 [Trichoderma harzianum CBS 226.95]PKK50503.1 hypothetical protein CI102_4903 [Trichoderma harzianum]PTB60288.1 hypothetical protein M431DRAFT_176770 [Trichoderma harzianum CBS 226.95]
MLGLCPLVQVQLCSLSSLFLRYRHLRHHHSLCLAIHRRTIPLVGQHGIWHPPESCRSLRPHCQHMWPGHHPAYRQEICRH